MGERKCKTCRWWNVHSIDLKEGDCMHRQDDGPLHRAYHVYLSDGSVAYMDSFGPEATKPKHCCSFWDGANATIEHAGAE